MLSQTCKIVIWTSYEPKPTLVDRKQVSFDLSPLRLPLQQVGDPSWLWTHVKGNLVGVMEQSSHEEGHLIVSKLSDRIGYAGPVCAVNGKSDTDRTC